jgi:hypothetical protein
MSRQKALLKGVLPIGGIELSCAVLQDGTRVLLQTSVFKAFSRSKRGLSKKRQDEAKIETNDGVLQLPAFVAASNLKPFIGKELIEVLQPVEYLDGTKKAFGYKAEILPELCNLYLEVRRQGVIVPQQEPLAVQAEVLLSSFAKVGITALIDEATGFQYDREYNALRILLERYIEEGIQKWVKRFPDKFFKEMDRLYHNPITKPTKRPQYYGKFINKYIYQPLEHGYVKQELDKRNITDEGRRRARFHQWLTEFGVNQLTIQMGRVLGLMEISPNLRRFKDYAKRQSGLSTVQLKFWAEDEEE